MAIAYRQALLRGVNPGKLRNTQIEWKINVRDACNDVACLRRAYEQRAGDLDNLAN
ncbi:MAG: hypothetical protein ACREUQ_01465 [Burkholderiales bacterium]